MIERERTVKIPRPPGKHRRKRAMLAVNMHPAQLAGLEQRAADASMSLGAYVSALLFQGEEADTCDHGIALGARGAGACVRCARVRAVSTGDAIDPTDFEPWGGE